MLSLLSYPACRKLLRVLDDLPSSETSFRGAAASAAN